ncbi:hypothetical protein [Agarivorans sp. OAG1]|uniref:hypothetical protein n=1 Tax=Agarivorans sp. OAG1 TaxID=3082387 RepID=UPI0030CEF023
MRLGLPHQNWQRKALLVLVCMLLLGILPKNSGFFRSDYSFEDTSEICGTVTSYINTGEGHSTGKAISAWYLIVDNDKGRFEFNVDRPFIQPYIPDFSEHIDSQICIEYIPIQYSSRSNKFVVNILFDGKELLNKSLVKEYYFTPISPLYPFYLFVVFVLILILTVRFDD